jgi:hypothetical protein
MKKFNSFSLIDPAMFLNSGTVADRQTPIFFKMAEYINFRQFRHFSHFRHSLIVRKWILGHIPN